MVVIVQRRTGTNGRLVQEQKVSTVDPKEKADSTKIKFQFKGVLEPGMTFRSTSAFDSSERGKTGPYL
jgi:hypothetical protein